MENVSDKEKRALSLYCGCIGYLNDLLEEVKRTEKEPVKMKRYVDYVYDIVKFDREGMDAIYADYILKLVGERGFTALHVAGLIEGCGVVNGRQLYVLCEK